MTATTGIARRREANPVLVKELRGRFRGPRAFVALTAFLVVLATVAYLLYATQAAQMSRYYSGYYRSNLDMAAELGRNIFTAVAVLEMVLIAFIGPSLTMNAISGEVERQTYELLLATPLSGSSILLGKLGAAMAFVLLLMFSAIPVMSLAFLFGGVTATSMVQVQLAVLVGGYLFVAIGLFYSSLFKRTVRAAISSYLTVGVISILPAIAYYVMAMLWWNRSGDPDGWWVAALFQTSPFAALLSVVLDAFSGNHLAMFWGQALVLQLIIGSFFVLMAASRVRRVGRGALVAILVLVLVLWAWSAWVMALNPLA